MFIHHTNTKTGINPCFFTTLHYNNCLKPTTNPHFIHLPTINGCLPWCFWKQSKFSRLSYPHWGHVSTPTANVIPHLNLRCRPLGCRYYRYIINSTTIQLSSYIQHGVKKVVTIPKYRAPCAHADTAVANDRPCPIDGSIVMILGFRLFPNKHGDFYQNFSPWEQVDVLQHFLYQAQVIKG